MKAISMKRFMISFTKRACAPLEATMLLGRLSSLLKRDIRKSRPLKKSGKNYDETPT